MPDWFPYALWPLVVALLTSATLEPLKWRLWKAPNAKGRQQWTRAGTGARKALLMSPVLAVLGAGWGGLIYSRTDLEPDLVLAAILGAATGTMTPVLRDFAWWIPSFAKRALKVRAGVTEETITMPTVEPATMDEIPTMDGR
jgi:hypothetical protein